MKKLIDWYADALGGHRTLYTLFSVFVVSRALDMASTYYFLSRSGWNYELEANHIFRWMFYSIGFWPSVAINMVGGIIFAFAGVAVMSVLVKRKIRNTRKQKFFSTGVLFFLSLLSVLVALSNVGIDIFKVFGIYNIVLLIPADHYVTFVLVTTACMVLSFYILFSVYEYIRSRFNKTDNRVK